MSDYKDWQWNDSLKEVEWIVGTIVLGNYWRTGNREGIRWKDNDEGSGLYKIEFTEGQQLL